MAIRAKPLTFALLTNLLRSRFTQGWAAWPGDRDTGLGVERLRVRVPVVREAKADYAEPRGGGIGV